MKSINSVFHYFYKVKYLSIVFIATVLLNISACSTAGSIRTYIQGIPNYQTVIRLYSDSSFTIHTNTHLGGVDTVAFGKWTSYARQIKIDIDTTVNSMSEFEWLSPPYRKYLYMEYQSWHLNKTGLRSDSGDIFLREGKFNRLAK